MLLSIQNLHVWFELRRFGFGHAGYVRAVDDVTFDLHHGEAIAVVGESGCGKSSLMKTILALYKPTKGEIIFQRQGSSASSTQHRTALVSLAGWICSAGPLWGLPPFMTVHRILEEPLIIGGVKDKAERDAAHPQGQWKK